MAILFCDSCGDHLAAGDILTKYTSGTLVSIVSGVHGNAYSGPNLTLAVPTFSGHTPIYHGRWKFTGLGAQQIYAAADSLQIEQFTIRTQADGSLQLRRGGAGTVLATSAVGILAVGTWYVIEAKVLVNAGAGTVDIKVDGTSVLSTTGLTTTNTSTGYSGTLTTLSVGNNGLSAYLDDLVLCDASGTAPDNDFLGDCWVEALLPQTDAVAAGSNAGWTVSSGSDHGALVDESTPNDDTDYVSTATATAKDTYNYPSLASSGTIYGVQTLLYARKTDGALKQIASVLRHSGSDNDGSTKTISTVYRYYPEMKRLNPGTGIAWTTSDVNAVQHGPKLVT